MKKNRFFGWLADRLGITKIEHTVAGIKKDVVAIRRKATVKPRRYDQIERDRSGRKHPARHH